MRVTHRHLDGREVYFIINDSAQPWAGEVTFAATRNGERWNPASGQCDEHLAASSAELSLEPYGAALFRFTAANPPARKPAATGTLPNLRLNRVPNVAPALSQGEFVRGGVQPGASRSASGSPAWQASAVLTKGKVDTFLFARFHFDPPLDLSDADCLAFETWVPQGQSTPNHLLAILHEQGGGDFLAETGRSLAAPGREQSFITLSRFQLAGWSKDADGVLDPRRVSDLSVGWGGYLGTKGEQVQFTLALPQVGVVIDREPEKRSAAGPQTKIKP